MAFLAALGATAGAAVGGAVSSVAGATAGNIAGGLATSVVNSAVGSESAIGGMANIVSSKKAAAATPAVSSQAPAPPKPSTGEKIGDFLGQGQGSGGTRHKNDASNVNVTPVPISQPAQTFDSGIAPGGGKNKIAFAQPSSEPTPFRGFEEHLQEAFN